MDSHHVAPHCVIDMFFMKLAGCYVEIVKNGAMMRFKNRGDGGF